MIQLTDTEKQWIKMCKGHYKDIYPYKGSWVKTLQPLFIKQYGWNPKEDKNYNDYLTCIFNRLLELQLKISDDRSGNNIQLKDVFSASFSKGIYYRNERKPIERAIGALCGLIQNNQVIENGVPRYEIDWSKS